jgi:peptide/nickel transport system substrate-binding protein
MYRTKFVLSLLLVLAMAFGFTAVGNVSAQESAITIAFPQEPDTFSHFYSNMSFGKWVNNLVYAPLYMYDDVYNEIPVLIDEIPTVENGLINEDYTEYTVRIKEGLVWSDGTPLTSEDVAFTYEMLNTEANQFIQGSPVRDAVETVEVVDERTTKLTLATTSPYVGKLLSVEAVAILPKHVFAPVFEAEGTLANADANQNPTVFSGPYMLTEWRRGESLTFTANPDYVLGKPKIETLVIRIFPDPESGYAALAAGQVDLQPNLGPTDGPRVLELNPDLKVVGYPGGYIELLLFNLRGEDNPRAGHPALQDIRVRQAIRLGINREAIANDLLAGAAVPTDSIYAGNAVEDTSLEFVSYDPEAAMALLDEAGWVVGADGIREKDGVRLELRYPTTTAAYRRDVQAVIQQQLAEIGVGIVLENYPAAEYFGAFTAGGTLAVGEFDLGEFANSTSGASPTNDIVNDTIGCDSIVSVDNPGGSNYGSFCSEEMDELYANIATTLDQAQVAEYAAQIQQIVRDELPVIILFPRNDIYAYNPARFAADPKLAATDFGFWWDVHNWELK